MIVGIFEIVTEAAVEEALVAVESTDVNATELDVAETSSVDVRDDKAVGSAIESVLFNVNLGTDAVGVVKVARMLVVADNPRELVLVVVSDDSDDADELDNTVVVGDTNVSVLLLAAVVDSREAVIDALVDSRLILVAEDDSSVAVNVAWIDEAKDIVLVFAMEEKFWNPGAAAIDDEEKLVAVGVMKEIGVTDGVSKVLVPVFDNS